MTNSLICFGAVKSALIIGQMILNFPIDRRSAISLWALRAPLKTPEATIGGYQDFLLENELVKLYGGIDLFLGRVDVSVLDFLEAKRGESVGVSIEAKLDVSGIKKERVT